MRVNISDIELTELYEYILTQLGAGDVNVKIDKEEIKVLCKKAFKDYIEFIQNWQIQNQFSNIMGFSSDINFTNKFISDNGMLAQRMSDWFASMARVGGNTKWKKDYITLVDGRQVYDLSKESSIPYKPGDRRIHKVMWYGSPEIVGNQTDGNSIDGGLVSFGYSGLMFGQNLMSYLGNAFDVVLLAQSLETRNKILRSEFFYNLSGDMIEITPVPGSGFTGMPRGAKVFYYYFDQVDFLGLEGQQGPDGETNPNELISNPTQVKIDIIDYTALNHPAKNWIENWTFALSKYLFGSKLRMVKKIASSDSEYQVEFDYQSLINEYEKDKEELFTKLKDYLAELNEDKLMEKKASISDNAAKVNNRSPRLIYVGTLTLFLLNTYLYTHDIFKTLI